MMVTVHEPTHPLQQAGWFLAFLACGLFVFVVFSHYYPVFSGWVDIAGRIVVALAFLFAALFCRRNERNQALSRVWFAFFVACVAISVDYHVGLSRFTLMHSGVEYTASILIFIGMLLPLSLAWGWLLQKTDSVWGSILFHAAMDIPIALGLFSNLE